MVDHHGLNTTLEHNTMIPLVLSIVFYLIKDLPDTCGVSLAGRQILDPCKKETCPEISTNLLSSYEYFLLRKSDSNKNLKNNNTQTKNANREETFYGIPFGNSKSSKRIYRLKRSQARTIISLNTNHTMEKVKMDPKRFWSNTKCHKYAIFKVFYYSFL